MGVHFLRLSKQPWSPAQGSTVHLLVAELVRYFLRQQLKQVAAGYPQKITKSTEDSAKAVLLVVNEAQKPEVQSISYL
jgi:hypothetical protein